MCIHSSVMERGAYLSIKTAPPTLLLSISLSNSFVFLSSLISLLNRLFPLGFLIVHVSTHYHSHINPAHVLNTASVYVCVCVCTCSGGCIQPAPLRSKLKHCTVEGGEGLRAIILANHSPTLALGDKLHDGVYVTSLCVCYS